MTTPQPLEWRSNQLRILDQTRLPTAEIYLDTADYRVVAAAIRELQVRGAPAIGVAGAYGIALGALEIKPCSPARFRTAVQEIIQTIEATRPTARNLFWAAERMARRLTEAQPVARLKRSLVAEAVAIHRQEGDYSRKISAIGASLVVTGSTVLTHCNTGPLATTGTGTALGVIIHSFQHGKQVRVLVDETRPLLQGSRLTAWELRQAGVPFTLITDSMAGYFMGRREVDAVIVGADRIAANGDTANKIGTYSLAVLAKAHRIPFYVAAPTSTIDRSLRNGQLIQIEQRLPDEVTRLRGIPIAPDGIDVANPAFDVTPARLITAIITERGIMTKPFGRWIRTNASN
jgi:methylthioribose-1-phosphate isomerase